MKFKDLEYYISGDKMIMQGIDEDTEAMIVVEWSEERLQREFPDEFIGYRHSSDWNSPDGLERLKQPLSLMDWHKGSMNASRIKELFLKGIEEKIFETITP